MSPLTHSSGDPRLDRRYDWAREALAEGDATAAVDILSQTVAEAPGFAAGWHLLGQAHEKLGDHDGAAKAYAEAAAHDAAGVLGAKLDVARLEAAAAGGVIAGQQAAYVTALFDDYAPRYDKHLRQTLRYRGPEALLEGLMRAKAKAGPPFRFESMLDLGCGTGLAGEVFAPFCRAMTGVDLAPRMVAKAREKGAGGKLLYAQLHTGDGVAFLQEQPANTYDLIIAADVMVYLGDLGALLAAAAQTLASGGYMAFTAQESETADILIGQDKRFAHSPAYLERALTGAGLTPMLIESAVIRHEYGKPVPSQIAIARKLQAQTRP
ncbi:MAG: class I SAM-dependent DNA methyltransferase [Bosea sp. (in: a-proteobacteria)]